jgi:hypothetical protein
MTEKGLYAHDKLRVIARSAGDAAISMPRGGVARMDHRKNCL